MDVHYVWIGEPCVDPVVAGSSLFHDVAGPTMLSRVWGGGRDQIHFWCLRAYATLYRSYFENRTLFPNPILVHACEDFLDGINRFYANLKQQNQQTAGGSPLHWDLALLDGVDAFCQHTGFIEKLSNFSTKINSNTVNDVLSVYHDWICPGIERCVRQNMIGEETLPGLIIRRRVNFKNLMSFVILHFCGGYFLDSNVFPWGSDTPTIFPNMSRFKTVAYLGDILPYDRISMRYLTLTPDSPIPPAIVWANKVSEDIIIDDLFAKVTAEAGFLTEETQEEVKCFLQDVWMMASPAFNINSLVALSNHLFLMNVVHVFLETTKDWEEYKGLCANTVVLSAIMGYSDYYLRDKPFEQSDLPFWHIVPIEPSHSLVGVRALGIVKYRLGTHGTRRNGAQVPLTGPAAVPLAMHQLIHWQKLVTRGASPHPMLPPSPASPPAMVLDPGVTERIRTIRGIVQRERDRFMTQGRFLISKIFKYEIENIAPNRARVVSRLIKLKDTTVIAALDITMDMSEEETQRAVFHFMKSE